MSARTEGSQSRESGGRRMRATTPTRGEYGLARFHRLIGYASFAAAMCLMLASITALYWFAGVIGLPPIACAAVAIAIEVMAASLASSATTAYREDGRVDVTAWLGFAFFLSVAAFANVMHVIVFIDTSVAPPWFGQAAFIAAACIFAAACPLGGTWGVHRYGWLRAHGADATWTDTDRGVQVQGRSRARTPRRAARNSRAIPQTPAVHPDQAPAAADPVPARQPVPVRAQAGSDVRDAARSIYTGLAADLRAGERVDAAELLRRLVEQVGEDRAPDVSTVRRWRNRCETDRQKLAAEVRSADPVDEPLDTGADDPRYAHAV